MKDNITPWKAILRLWLFCVVLMIMAAMRIIASGL